MSFAFLLVALAALLGGHKVPGNDFPDNTPCVGPCAERVPAALKFPFTWKG